MHFGLTQEQQMIVDTTRAFVEKELGCPLVLVSTGPRRAETIVLRDPFVTAR